MGNSEVYIRPLTKYKWGFLLYAVGLFIPIVSLFALVVFIIAALETPKRFKTVEVIVLIIISWLAGMMRDDQFSLYIYFIPATKEFFYYFFILPLTITYLLIMVFKVIEHISEMVSLSNETKNLKARIFSLILLSFAILAFTFNTPAQYLLYIFALSIGIHVIAVLFIVHHIHQVCNRWKTVKQ